MLRLASLFLLLASLARAAPILLYGADEVNSAASNTQSLFFRQNLSGGATAASLVHQKTTIHNAASGGSSTSQWAIKVTVTSGQQAYYDPPVQFSCTGSGTPFTCCESASVGFGCWDKLDVPATCSGATCGGVGLLSAAMSVHLETAPGSGRRQLFDFMSSVGPECGLAIDTSGKVQLTYNDLPIGSLSPGKLGTAGCADSPFTPLGAVVCTPGSCPGGSCECPPGIACTAGIGWPGLEVVQEPALCEAWLSGKKFASVAQSTNPIRTFRVGATGTESVGLTAEIDDLVLDDGVRAHFGYVERETPSYVCDASCPNGAIPCAVDADCGTPCTGSNVPGSGTKGCWKSTASQNNDQWNTNQVRKPDSVNAYGKNSFLYDSSTFLNKSTTGSIRTQNVEHWVPPINPGSLVISAIESVIVGFSPTASGDHFLGHQILDNCNPNLGLNGCGVAAARTVKVRSHLTSSDDRVLDRFILSEVPSQSQRWDLFRLTTVTGQLVAVDTNATKVSAWLLNVRVQRPDATPRKTLKTHNKGTDVPRITIAGVGDSTTGGVASVTCQQSTAGNIPCTVPKYCKWDTFHALPDGGCITDAQCKTCTNSAAGSARESETNGLAGYPCASDAECPTSGGVCDSSVGFCSVGNPGMACCFGGSCVAGVCSGGEFNGQSCNASCNFPVGTFCRVNDTTCVPSCPGPLGHCPTARTSWVDPLNAQVGADTILKCSAQGEPTDLMIQNRLNHILVGDEPTCTAVQGTGQCECTVDADCFGGTCGTDARTGFKLCSGGASQRTQCTQAQQCKPCATGTDCGPGGTCSSLVCSCVFDPASYFMPLEGVNYEALRGVNPPSATGPDCTGPGGVMEQSSYETLCNNCGTTQCLSNADCDSVAGPGASQCGGVNQAASADHCIFSTAGQFLGSPCTIFDPACRTTADCTIPAPCQSGGTCQQPTCVGGAAGEYIPHGFCQCANDNQCAAGYKCVGKDSSTNCSGGGCGWCRALCNPSDSSHACSSAFDCPFLSPCIGGFCNDCGVGFTCDPTTLSCKGACTCPDGVCPGPLCGWNDGNGHNLTNHNSTCAADTDCPTHKVTDHNNGVTRTYTGTCDIANAACTGFRAPAKCCTGNAAGHCHGTNKCVHQGRQANRLDAFAKNSVCTGLHAPARCCVSVGTGTCDTDGGDAPENFLDYIQPVAHWRDVKDYHTIDSTIAALSETDGRPFIVFHPVPAVNCTEGNCTWYDTMETIRARGHVLREFDGRAVDTDRCIEGTPLNQLFVDPVHYGLACAQGIGGGCTVTFLDSQDTCAIVTRRCADQEDKACTSDADCTVVDVGVGTAYRAGRPGKCLHRYTPQMYCRNLDNSFSSTICDPSGLACPNGATCEPRPCTASCNTDQDCKNWFGDGPASTQTCSSGACICTGANCPGGAGDSCKAFGAGYANASGVCKNGGNDSCSVLTGSGKGDVCHVEGVLE